MHCLFSPAGDKINDRDLVWAAVKDLAVGDALRYRAVPKSVILSNTSDSTVKIDLDIDFARPLSRCVPLMCRRFGVRLTQVDAIKTDGGIGMIFFQRRKEFGHFLMKSRSTGWFVLYRTGQIEVPK